MPSACSKLVCCYGCAYAGRKILPRPTRTLVYRGFSGSTMIPIPDAPARIMTPITRTTVP